ncbi:MAG: RnfABCDGE type electron transport complex subunit D [Planctomycetota bacterium]
MTRELLVSTSPHIRDEITTTRIMWAVAIALAPATGMGIWFFGVRVLAQVLVSVAAAILTEYVIQKWRKVPVTAMDGSAFVTGLLLVLVISPAVPLPYVALGAVFSIGIGKQVFGGLGRNIWNPALVGRAFMQVSFPSIMNAMWIAPRGVIDAVTGPTPLAAVKEAIRAGGTMDAVAAAAPHWADLAWGKELGCAGETSAIALLVGGLLLIGLKIIDWRVPFIYIGTAVLFCWLLPVSTPNGMVWFADQGWYPVFHLLSGGLFLGGFFMATDLVTTPYTVKGRVIFAVGAGLLVAIIRVYGGYPEGVCYSILIMNTAVPLIDKFTLPRPFGARKPETRRG